MSLTALLRPPLPDLLALVRPDDVGGRVAFDVLLADGALRRVYRDRAVAAGSPVTAQLRLLALAPDVPARCTVGRTSAAWVYLGGPVPHQVSVLYPPRCHRPPPRRSHVSHQALLAPDEVVRLGSVAVTTPARTAADLALFAPPDVATAALRDLLSHACTDVPAVLRALERRAGDVAHGHALDVLRAAARAAQEGRPSAFVPVIR